MNLQLIWICAIILAGMTSSYSNVAQPSLLEKLLRERNYKRFSELTKVPENIAVPFDGSFEDQFKIVSQEFGDLMILPHQMQKTDEDDRTHLNGRLSLWEGAEIPYAILKANFTIDDVEMIQANIESYNRLLGGVLRWRPQTPADKNYVAIFRGAGCFTHVGHVGGVQAISLRQDMPYQPCMTTGWIHHEMTHTAGLMHQSNRLDRDLYTPMNAEAIPYSIRRWYTDVLPILSTLDNNLTYFEIMGPFEYLSLMQQPYSMSGATPFFETPRFEGDPNDIGDTANQDLTEQDVQMLKRLYTGKAGGGGST